MVSRIVHLKLTVDEDISLFSFYSSIEKYLSSFQTKEKSLVYPSIEKNSYRSFNNEDWNIFHFVQGYWC